MDRSSELDAFKSINLSLIASAHGYEMDRRKSTRHSVLMASGADKIIIAQNGQHYIYCSVHDPSSSGTAIDFAQNVIEPGCSLGRVRQILRPFLGSGYAHDLQTTYRGKFASDIKPSQTDLLGVAARFSHFNPIEEPHEYLCNTRGIPFELLKSERLHDRVRHCLKRGSIVFPHWGCPDDTGSKDRCLTGYEIKGPGVNMFSKGGRKGLWMSAGLEGDRVLAFGESGLDALSYLAEQGEANDVRIASLSGKMNPSQPLLVKSAIARMEEGSTIVAAFDNDQGGDQLTEQLADIVSKLDRSDLEFKDDRPAERGADWNKVLVDRLATTKGVSLSPPAFGR
jgi:hypothetical protein